MVTAICITGLLIYFYFISVKDRKKNFKKWENVGLVEEEAIVRGKVGRFFRDKRRFYHSKWIWHTEIMVNDGTSQTKVILEKPIREETEPLDIHKGEFVTCYGRFDGGYFLANRVETSEMKRDG